MEPTHPQISVIVPVYNAEKYLPRCIDSVLIQTFTEFELLLINDGSKDRSGQICNEYAEKDKRIRVFNKSNEGVCSARKLGFDKSYGEWIVFVDSDDELKKDALKSMMELHKEKEFDLLVTSKSLINPNNEKYLYNKISGYLSTGKYVCSALKGNIFIGPHGRMTKRDLFIKSNAFDIPKDIVINEDLIMNLKLGIVANKILISNNINTYKYYNNPNIASKNIKDLIYWDKVFNIIDNILTKNNLYKYKEVKKAYYSFILKKIRVSTQEPTYLKNNYFKKIEKSNPLNIIFSIDYILLKYRYLDIFIKRLKKFI